MCRTAGGSLQRWVDPNSSPQSARVRSVPRQRLNPISLEVRYKGKHSGRRPSNDCGRGAAVVFPPFPKIVKRLETLISVGLPYLQLGQSSPPFWRRSAKTAASSRELAKRESGDTLYLIDEPTVGLHPKTPQTSQDLPPLADRKIPSSSSSTTWM